jgi:hypothetical protein
LEIFNAGRKEGGRRTMSNIDLKMKAIARRRRAEASGGKTVGLEPELAWGDVPGQALRNAPGSAVEFGKSIAEPFLHPISTVQNLADLTQGTLSLAARSGNEWLSDRGLSYSRLPPPGETETKQMNLSRDVGGFFKDRYGSIEGLKKTLATDPVGAAADLASVLSGGSGAAARVPGSLAAATARTLGTASRLANPVEAAAKVGRVIPYVAGITTGAGPDAIREAFRAGTRGGQYGKRFRDSMRGKVPGEVFVDESKSALHSIEEARHDEYMKNMASVRGAKTEIDPTPIYDELSKTWDSLHANEAGTLVKSPEALKMLEKIGDTIDNWVNDPDGTTAIGLDALKQRIDDMAPPYTESNAQVTRVITAMRNAVKNQIVKEVPEYATAMKKFEASTSELKEIERSLLQGKKASVDQGLRRMQSIFRNNANTNYGNRVNMAKVLERAGAENIMPGLAGQQLNAIAPRGLASLLAGASGYAAFSNPSLIALLPASSPRLVGEAAHGIGRANRAVGGNVPQKLLASFQAGRINQRGGEKQNSLGVLVDALMNRSR